MLIFIASSGPTAQRELGTKDVKCSCGVAPLRSSVHLLLDSAILWNCKRWVSASDPDPVTQKLKRLLSWMWSSSRGRLFSVVFFLFFFSSEAQRGFRKWVEDAEPPQSDCEHQQELARSCSSSLHRRDRVCPSPGQLHTLPAFSGGEVTSVQMLPLSSISCAHVHHSCPEITPQTSAASPREQEVTHSACTRVKVLRYTWK